MKREPVHDEHEQNGWLGRTLRQSPAGAGDAHVDTETLAAWADGGLSAKAAAAVELHASTCPRCTAVLAAMARTAPPVSASHAWTRARLFRWVVPLTAAATAVAIWIAVPDRPITPVEDLKTASEHTAVPVPVPVPVPIPVPEAAPLPGPAPKAATPSAEPQAQVQLRDEFRRENAVREEAGAAGAAPQAPSQEPAPAPRQDAPFAPEPASPPPAAAPSARTTAPAAAADAHARETSPTAANDALQSFRRLGQRSAQSKSDFSTESVSPANPQIRWRVVGSGRIERSTNGAKTWTPTNVPPASLMAIRAVDGNRAVARTSDNAEFYTTDGGRSWTRVQENSQAPF